MPVSPSSAHQQRAIGRLEALLGEALRQGGVHHAVMHAETRDGAFRWRGAGGVASPDGRPMTVDTPVFLASIDKLYTATLVLLLHEEGRIDLDAPIRTYLSDSLARGLHRMDGIDHTPRISVRHLLSHASGLPDWLEDRPRGGRSFLETVLVEGDRAVTIDDIVDHVRTRLSPSFPPQDLSSPRPRIEYSDTNFVLLAAIVEEAEGRPLHEVYAQRLLRPLGLSQTWLPGHNAPLAPVVEPASLWAGERTLDLPRLLASIRAVYATTRDAVAFLRALENGEVFRGRHTLDTMRGRWNGFPLSLDLRARKPGWPIQYALGTMRFRLPRLLAGRRPMPAVTGHTGSTGVWLFHCPDLDVLLCGCVDQVTAGALPFRLVPRMLRAIQETGISGAGR